MKFRWIFQVAGVALIGGSVAHAQLASFGPISQFGYPEYYTDTNGLSIAHGVDPNDPFGLVPFAPLPDPNSPPNVATGNFWDELFYWNAQADLTTSGGVGSLILALESTFNNATAAVIDGDQIVFTRIRIRVDVPNTPASAGTYTVVHPYGTEVFEVTAADIAATGGLRVINFSDDSLVFDVTPFGGPLNPASRVNPFLQWDATLPAPPVGYVGNPNLPHTVTGSPTGNNLFRITGPGINPNGSNTLETDQFLVMGKIAPTGPPDPGLGGSIVCTGDAGCPCGNNSAANSGQGCLTTAAQGMILSASGSTSFAAANLVLTATNVPRGNSGIFYCGNALIGPNNLFDGLQCAGGFTIRFRGHIAPASGIVSDSGFLGQDSAALGLMAPGNTVHFHYFSRDNQNGVANSPCGLGANLSSVLSLTMTP